MIENTFKYLGFYGIDWLLDYHAEIAANTKLVDNPARTQANTAIRAAKADLAEAQRALGELINADLSVADKNTAIPGAQQALTHHADNIRTLITERNKIPTQLPANQINPDAKRALLRLLQEVWGTTAARWADTAESAFVVTNLVQVCRINPDELSIAGIVDLIELFDQGRNKGWELCRGRTTHFGEQIQQRCWAITVKN